MQRKTCLGQVSAAPITFRCHDANDACSRTPSCPTRPPFRMASAPKARLAGEPTTLRPAGTSPAASRRPSSTAPLAPSSAPSAPTVTWPRGSILSAPTPRAIPALEPSYHGLDQAILERVPAALLSVAVPGESAAEVLPRLREIYCGPVAYQIEHLSSHVQRRWLREAIESGRYAEPLHGDEQQAAADPAGAGRGVRALPEAHVPRREAVLDRGRRHDDPMLDEAIAIAAAAGTREAVIGMAHRGRLNVLAHVLHRTYASILAEFEGRPASEVADDLPEGGFGDVKYHHGAHSSARSRAGRRRRRRRALEKRTIELSLMPNPSHLEFVNPVVDGQGARPADRPHALARGARSQRRAVPITIHGDAAFPGQGIVAETLNLQSLDGYSTGGTLHLIANNQVGFTTDPRTSARRSTRPTWPRASTSRSSTSTPTTSRPAAPRRASRWRSASASSATSLIDLVGYRRWGHNEGDEPAYTQPQLYERIAEHPPVAELYARRLIDEGVVTEEDVAEIRRRVAGAIAEAHAARPRRHRGARARGLEEEAARAGRPARARAAELERAERELLAVPEGFTVHPKLASQLERRRAALDDGRHRLGPRRVARVRLAAAQRRADPAHGPGLRARHVRPPPRRPARRATRARRTRRCSTCRAPRRASRSTTRRSPRTRASASSTATRSPSPTRS